MSDQIATSHPLAACGCATLTTSTRGWHRLWLHPAKRGSFPGSWYDRCTGSVICASCRKPVIASRCSALSTAASSAKKPSGIAAWRQARPDSLRGLTAAPKQPGDQSQSVSSRLGSCGCGPPPKEKTSLACVRQGRHSAAGLRSETKPAGIKKHNICSLEATKASNSDGWMPAPLETVLLAGASLIRAQPAAMAFCAE